MADDLFGKYFLPKKEAAKPTQKAQPKPAYVKTAEMLGVSNADQKAKQVKAQNEQAAIAKRKYEASARTVAIKTAYGTFDVDHKGGLTPQKYAEYQSKLENWAANEGMPKKGVRADVSEPAPVPSEFDFAKDIINKSELTKDILDAFPARSLMKTVDPEGRFSQGMSDLGKKAQVPNEQLINEGPLTLAEFVGRQAVNVPGQIFESYGNFINPKTDNVGVIQSGAEFAVNVLPMLKPGSVGWAAYKKSLEMGATKSEAIAAGLKAATVENIGIDLTGSNSKKLADRVVTKGERKIDALSVPAGIQSKMPATSQADNFSDAIGAPRATPTPDVPSFQQFREGAKGADVPDDAFYEDFYGGGQASKAQGAAEPASGTVTPPKPHFTDGYEPTGMGAAPTSAPGVNMTASANRFTDEVRKQFDLPGRTKPEPQTMKQWAEEAQGVDVDDLMARIDTAERPTATAPEQIALGAKMSELQDELDMLGDQYRDAAKKGVIPDELNDRMDSVRSRLQKTIEASETVGTETSRTFNARKALVKADYSVAGIIKKQVRELKRAGKKVGTEDVAFAEAQANRIKELEDRLAALPQEKMGVGERRRSVRKATLEKEAESIINQIKALGEKKTPTPTMRGKQGGAINVGKLPQYVDLYAQYAANLAKRGYSTVDDIYAEIVKVAKEVGHSLSKQELIDAMDGWYLKNSGKKLASAQKDEIRARMNLKKEITSGSTRAQEKATAKAAEAENATKLREMGLEFQRMEANAKRKAAQLESEARRAAKAEDRARIAAEAKAMREEAARLRQENAQKLRDFKAKINKAVKPLENDAAAIERLKARKDDLDAMLKSGDFWGTGKVKQTSNLTDQRDLIQFQVDQAKKQVDRRIEDMSKSKGQKAFEEVFNSLRGIKLGYDFGAIGRQGFDVFFQSPTSWAGGIKDGVQSMNKVKAATLNKKMLDSSIGLEAQRMGLNVDDVFNHGEELVSSKVMGILPGYSALERFHVATQNGMRLRLYETMTRVPGITDKEKKGAAMLINAMTGRGNWNVANKLTNTVLTAPKMYAGQAEMMTAWLNPTYNSSAITRKALTKRNLGRIGALTGLAAIGKQYGWEMSLNPDDSDFLKLRKGDSIIEVAGGYTPYYRAFFKVLNDGISPSRKNSPDFGEAIGTVMKYKINPGLTTPMAVLSGKDAVGQKRFRDAKGNWDLTDGKSYLETLGSISANDIRDMAYGEKFTSLSKGEKAGIATMGLAGFGTQSYANKDPRKKGYEDTILGQILRQFGVEPK
jgi:hypothetical protein